MKKSGHFIAAGQNAVLVSAAVFRIVLADLLGTWYPPTQSVDDRLLVNYANLSSHFHNAGTYSLVKNMSYPLFLNFVHATGLTYTMVLAILWILAALSAAALFRKITSNRALLLFVYLFVLFTPAAFDSWIGTRLYRNSIQAPFTFLFFIVILKIFWSLAGDENLSVKKLLLEEIYLGILLTFNFYISENGIWLLGSAVLFMLADLVFVIQRLRRKKGSGAIAAAFAGMLCIFLIPLFIFESGTVIYKSVNKKYFGVAEINTRTEGEPGRFVANVYRIQSDMRSSEVWAPSDAIRKAFAAASVLNTTYPGLENEVLRNTTYTSMMTPDGSPYGDFLTWILRDALEKQGIWKSEEQINTLFAQANKEIEDAFRQGKLEEDRSFRISSMAGGRNFSEIAGLFRIMKQEGKSILFLDGYVPGGTAVSGGTDETSQFATVLTRVNFVPVADPSLIQKETDTGNRIAGGIFKIYSILNPVLMLAAFLGAIFFIIRIFAGKKRHTAGEKKGPRRAAFISMFLLAGIASVYLFGIGWFAEVYWILDSYQPLIPKYYSVSAVPLFSLCCLTGICLLLNPGHTDPLSDNQTS